VLHAPKKLKYFKIGCYLSFVSFVCMKFLSSQHIIKVLNQLGQNPRVHHLVHNSLPPNSILSQVNPFHTLPANLPNIHLDFTHPSTPRSFEWSLSFGLSHQNRVCFSVPSHPCYMPRYPRFEEPNNIWERVKIMKL
jgi:hypothetical protein